MRLLIPILLLFTSCSRSTWQAIGYADREHPEAGKISLGTYSSEAEARAAGVGYMKAGLQHDYIIGVLGADGALTQTRR